MRINFVTQWFPPEPGTLVAAAIADGLGARGHEVHVLTGFPNYPTGSLMPGYPLRPYRRDARSAHVTVHRAPLIPSHDASPVRRIANYLSFAASASVIARTRLPAPDVWLTFSSPATTALPALTVPRRLRAPSYLLVQDLWPDSVTESGFVTGRAGRGMEAALHHFCDWTYRRATGIGIISPSMADLLVERGVDPAKIRLLPNWIEDTHLRPADVASDALRHRLGLPTGRLFMYAGNLGELQGLEPLVLAFGQCPEAQLVLVGDGIARASLQELVTDHDLANVKFVPSQPADRIGAYIAASDIQVVSLRDTRLLRATMPSKLQSCLAASRPVFASAAGDVADLVTLDDVGVAVAPGDVPAAIAAILRMCALSSRQLVEMGRRGRRRYEQDFAPEPGLDRLERLLDPVGAMEWRR